MVISGEDQYLFKIPFTASSAIRHEPCACYDSEPLLLKHASCPAFVRMPTHHLSGDRDKSTLGRPISRSHADLRQRDCFFQETEK